jgi:WD40 repeat protein
VQIVTTHWDEPADKDIAVIVAVGSFQHSARPAADEEAPLEPRRGYENLTFAHTRGTEVAASLTALGYRLHGDTVLRDPTHTAATTSLANAANALPQDRSLVVHIISHGHTDESGSLRIALQDSDPHEGLDVESWLRDLEREDRPKALVMLDVCYAGAAVLWQWSSWANRQRAERRRAGARRVWVLAAAAPDEQAYMGRFSRAVAMVLQRLHQDGLDTDPSLEYVPISLVTQAIRTQLDELWRAENGMQQHLESTPLALGEEPALRLFRNPRYQPTALARLSLNAEESLQSFLIELDPVLDAQHYITRAFGAADDSVATCVFTGRAAELDVLTPWLNDTTGATATIVVTGSPGTGKSALLGLLVCAAHPTLRSALLNRLPPLRLPGRAKSFAAVHARGRGTQQLVASIGRQLQLREPAPGWTPARLIEALRHRAGRGLPPATVVVDALDEALSPTEVVQLLLLPLCTARSTSSTPGKDDQRPACRLLVGTRAVDEAADLLKYASEQGRLLDLDQADLTVQRRDVAAFVRRHLELSPLYDSGPQEALRVRLSEELAAALVTVGARSGPGPYLLARLYLHQLLQREAINPNEITQTVGRAPRTVADMLELDLARMNAPWARPLLAALAHARHPGMPASLARHVAHALVGDTTRSAPEAEQLHETLERVGFYLRRTADPDGPTLYRLFHQELVDHLKSQPTADGSTEAKAVLTALLAPLNPDADGQVNWQLATPYHLRHALDHAREAGRLDELAADAEYLIHAGPPPDALRGALTDKARQVAAVYRMSGNRHQRADATARRSILAVDAMRSGRGTPAWLPSPVMSTMVPLWSAGSGGEEAPVAVLGTVGWAPDFVTIGNRNGRPAIYASAGTRTNVWDLETSQEISRPWIIGHTPLERRPEIAPDTSEIWKQGFTMRGPGILSLLTPSLTYHRTDGSQVQIDWKRSGALQITHEHPAPEAPTAPPLEDLSFRARSVASALDDSPLIAVATETGPVLLLDLDGPRLQLPVRLTGAEQAAHALALLPAGPRHIHVIARTASGVLTWTVDRPTDTDGTPQDIPALPLRRPDAQRYDGSGVVALVPQAPGRAHLAAVTEGGQVRLTALAGTDPSERILSGSTRPLTALGAALVGNQRMLVGASSDGTVRVWDVDAPTPATDRERHPGPVTAVATGAIGGRRVLVSATGDEVWTRETTTGRLLHRLSTGQLGITALLVTRLARRPVAVTAGADWTVRLWDLARAQPMGTPLVGHTGSIEALAVARLDGPPVLLTGGSDNTVAVWDLTTCSLIGEHPTAHDAPVTALAAADIDGRLHVVSAGEDATVRFWELTEDGLTRHTTASTPASVTCLTMTDSPLGPVVLTGGADRALRTWDAASGNAVGEPMEGHEGAVSRLTTGRYVGRPAVYTLGTDATLRAWDPAGRHPLTVLDLPMPGGALAWAAPDMVAVGIGKDLVVIGNTVPPHMPSALSR